MMPKAFGWCGTQPEEAVEEGAQPGNHPTFLTVPEFIHAALQYKNNEARGCPYFPLMWNKAFPVFEFHRMKAAEWLESRS